MPNAVEPEDYAIVVGIDTYPKLPRPLAGARNDVDAFRDWLIDPEGGGLDPNNVYRLVSPAPQAIPPQPGNDAIDVEFEKLIDLAAQRGGRVGRRLYIFLAGHGFARDAVLDSRLLAATGGPRATGNHVFGQKYAEWFQKAKYFDEVVLIMDCCRENYQSAPTREPPWDPVIGQRNFDVKFTYLFATKAFAAARELEFADGAAKVYRGVFTYAMLKVLRASRRSLTGTALRDLVNDYMLRLYQERGPNDSSIPRQQAECISSNPEPLLGTAEGGIRVEFVPVNRGHNQTLLVRDGKARNVIHTEECKGPFKVTLDPGLYSIGDDGGTWKELFEAVAGEAQRVEL